MGYWVWSVTVTGAFAALKIGTSKQISSEQNSEADITFHLFYTLKIRNTNAHLVSKHNPVCEVRKTLTLLKCLALTKQLNEMNSEVNPFVVKFHNRKKLTSVILKTRDKCNSRNEWLYLLGLWVDQLCARISSDRFTHTHTHTTPMANEKVCKALLGFVCVWWVRERERQKYPYD